MKLSTFSLIASSSLATAAPTNLQSRATGIQGFDISGYQDNVDFPGAYAAGARFVMIKATEGINYISSSFPSQYSGATAAGIIRGGYHFAHPSDSSGAEQATYFLANGGNWSNDGITLPGMLDIEYAPSGDTCYGLGQADMVAWIQDFVSTYKATAKRDPMIYSTNDWWTTCTGDSTAFSAASPLVLAAYSSSPGSIPGGWSSQSFWQDSDSYSFGGDSDIFDGDEAGLKKLATG